MTTVVGSGLSNNSVVNVFTQNALVTLATPGGFGLNNVYGTLNVTGFGFVYNGTTATAGTITGVTYSSAGFTGTSNQTWTNVNVSVVAAYNMLAAQNLQGFYSLFFGGNDTFTYTGKGISDSILYGYGGDDVFNISNWGFNDSVDGGTGNDTANLGGGYGNPLNPPEYENAPNFNIGNVETINLGAGYNYTLVPYYGWVGFNETRMINASALGASNSFVFNTNLNNGTIFSGNLVLIGGAGSDSFQGAAGFNIFDGGAGTDVVDFRAGRMGGTGIGVTADLSFSTMEPLGGLRGGWALFSKIENLTGSNWDDKLGGDSGDNVMDGWWGTNVLYGKSGNDTLKSEAGKLFGGFGNDTAIFTATRASYAVNTAGAVTTVTGPNGTATLRGVENLQFFDTTQSVATNEAVFTRADFDANGRADIVWQHDNGQAGIWLMDGTTILSNPYIGTSTGPTWRVIGTGDFDGDGKADVLWQNTGGQAGVWFMDGTTVLANPAVGSNPGPQWHVIASADLDGNGKADIIWQHDSGQAGIWLMDGQTMLANPKIGITPNPAWHVVAAGDTDGDGNADLIWRSDMGQVGIWFMDGETIRSTPVLDVNMDVSWKVVATGDFDANGTADLLWQNTNGQVAIWTTNGAHIVSKTNVLNPGSGMQAKGTADLNGDGMADIIFQNTNGQAGAWLMNGTSIQSQVSLGANPGSVWHIVSATSG